MRYFILKKEKAILRLLFCCLFLFIIVSCSNKESTIVDNLIKVNDNVLTTNRILNQKLESSYAAFEKQNFLNEGKVGHNYKKALEVKELSAQLIIFIEKMKAEVIAQTDGISVEEASKLSLDEVKRKDNYDKPTSYFIGEKDDASTGAARILKNKIVDYKNKLLNILDPRSREVVSIKIGLNTENTDNSFQGKLNWEKYMFDNTILAANIVLLNSLINEVKNTEYDILNELFSEIDFEDFKINQINAKIIPTSNYVLTGDNFEAQIFVAAYNTSSAPEIFVGEAADTVTGKIIGTPYPVEVRHGIGYLKIPAGAEGLKKYGGIIKVTNPGGVEKKYPFNGEYNVGRPAAIVSAVKMNIFYIGLDNPVSVSVPGIPAEKVSVSMSGGSITSTGRGNYAVRVSAVGKTTLNVIAELGGQIRHMGSFEFSIKKVPDPTPIVAGKKGGVISKSQLIAAPYVVAQLEDFLFEGVKYNVVSYTFSTLEGQNLKEVPITGARLNESAINLINKAKSGQILFFDNIRASGPGNDVRNLSSVILRLE